MQQERPRPAPRLEPQSVDQRPRIGLALAGGGAFGLIYEIGALRALEEAVEGIDWGDLDVYVGVNAGAMLASVLANKLGVEQICRIFIDNNVPAQPFDPESFFAPALREYLSRVRLLPGLFLQALARCVQNPLSMGVTELLGSFTGAIPAGIFDGEPIQQWFAELFTARGISNDFRALANKLYIVATDLDTGEAVRFGAQGYDHVAISKAVAASSALPGLYAPVRIDGRDFVDGSLKKTVHASVALEQGVDLLWCINPLVPFDANLAARQGNPRHEKLIDGGLPAVLAQTFRAFVHSRMEVGFAKYAVQYPSSDIIILEPDPADPTMFFTNVFGFADRLRICERAYQHTRRDLLRRHGALSAMLERHGLSLRADVLEDARRDRHVRQHLGEMLHRRLSNTGSRAH